MKAKTKWRVRLCSEDGNYTLKDGFLTEDDADTEAETQAESYGEGQEVYVEHYEAWQ